MATEKQIELYERLCEETGNDIDYDFINLSVSDASKEISELMKQV